MRAWLRGLHSRSLISEIDPTGFQIGGSQGMILGDWGQGLWASAGRSYRVGSDFGYGNNAGTIEFNEMWVEYDEPGNRRR